MSTPFKNEVAAQPEPKTQMVFLVSSKGNWGFGCRVLYISTARKATPTPDKASSPLPKCLRRKLLWDGCGVVVIRRFEKEFNGEETREAAAERNLMLSEEKYQKFKNRNSGRVNKLPVYFYIIKCLYRNNALYSVDTIIV